MRKANLSPLFNTPRQRALPGLLLILLACVGNAPLSLSAQSPAAPAYSEEEYRGLISSRNLNSLTAASAERRKVQVWLEEAARTLAAFKNRALTPDSRTTDFGGAVRIISNQALRREAEANVRKTEEHIRDLQQQLLMVDARIRDFEKARARGFMPIRNVNGQEVNASPTGFKNGEIQFITQDANLTLYSFPIDDIHYNSLTEVVRFIKRHIEDGSFLLDDLLLVNEKAFFEKLAQLNLDLGAPPKKNTGQFIATSPPKPQNDAQVAAQVEELRAYRDDLRKQESVDDTPVLFDQLEIEAEKVNSPVLHHFIAQRHLASGRADSLDKARLWANRSARQGHSPAYVTLGNLANKEYLLSGGFPEGALGDTDYRIAREWYEKAIENREPGGYWALGKMYLWGVGVPRNDALAADYIRQAALISDPVYAPQACFLLGVLYYQGRGVEKDHEKSIWWLRACANINPDSGVSALAKRFLSRNTFEVAQK